MDEPGLHRSASAQPTTSPLDDVRFDRAALLVGRSLYWGVSPEDHVAGMAALVQWCLGLPGARLGVSISDVATIVRDVSATLGILTPQLQQLLQSFGVNPRSPNQFEYDTAEWGDHLTELLQWMQQTATGDGYFWLDPGDVDWWLSATMRSLANYAPLFADGTDTDYIFRLISRHVGTVFAPFDGKATWDALRLLYSELPEERQRGLADLMDDPRLDRDRLAEISGVYWSWKLTDFANADGSIVGTPMLALWSEWPSSIEWAPRAAAGVIGGRRFSSEEITTFLQDTLWQRIESALSTARMLCGLGLAEPEFAGREGRPPIFFFAAPAEAPVRSEEYTEDLRPAIMPLVRSCLLSADPLADQVAWGLLEGDLVALRREVSDQRSYQARYLLLPTSSRASSGQAIEDDIGYVADRLTYLEFTISHEARDVSTDVEPLATHAGTWGGTLDSVNVVTGDAIDLLPGVHRTHLRHMIERLTGLHLVLRRLQTVIETGASDANQVKRKYDAYLDGTDDYFRIRLPSSAVPRVPTLNLRDSIQNAYPYQYLKHPVATLDSTMDQLAGSVARINESLSTVLNVSDRQNRDLASRLTGIFNFIIALLALAVGLAQVIGTPGRSSSNGQWIFVGIGGVLIAAAVLYFGTWFQQRLPKKRHPFMEGMRSFRALVDEAERAATEAVINGGKSLGAWRAVDLLDDQGVRILGSLWRELKRGVEETQRQAARGRGRGRGRAGRHMGRIRPLGVREWEKQARVLEHSIELFDLAPRTIALPRTLCILRFKGTDFRSRTTISDWEFAATMGALGYSDLEVYTLVTWLSIPANQRQIRQWDVATFAQTLKTRGVNAVPSQRTPGRWEGALADS